jgi:hypothetical protein
MAANIPLIESGTAGYLGQVQPLIKVRLSWSSFFLTKPLIHVFILG